jgi:hypothetical protein
MDIANTTRAPANRTGIEVERERLGMLPPLRFNADFHSQRYEGVKKSSVILSEAKNLHLSL